MLMRQIVLLWIHNSEKASLAFDLCEGMFLKSVHFHGVLNCLSRATLHYIAFNELSVTSIWVKSFKI